MHIQATSLGRDAVLRTDNKNLLRSHRAFWPPSRQPVMG
ncbi:hypothetical protein VCHA29O37_140077 [Vibrio chagasii]|nr:hypothetical protein VCHA29O37_140077 [Vibrio chagasii]